MSVPIGFSSTGLRFIGVTDGVSVGDCNITLTDGVSVGDCNITLTDGVSVGDCNIILTDGVSVGDCIITLTDGVSVGDCNITLTDGVSVGDCNITLTDGVCVGDCNITLTDGVSVGDCNITLTDGVCVGDCIITLTDGVSVGDCNTLTDGVGKVDEKDDVRVGTDEDSVIIDVVSETTVVVVCDVSTFDAVCAELVIEINVSKDNRVDDKDGVGVRIAKEVFEAVSVTIDVTNSFVTTVVSNIDGVGGIASEEKLVCSENVEVRSIVMLVEATMIVLLEEVSIQVKLIPSSATRQSSAIPHGSGSQESTSTSQSSPEYPGGHKHRNSPADKFMHVASLC